VQFEPGCLWVDVDSESAPLGLATVGGTFSATGTVGLVLGGGVGWLSGKHGFSSDQLLAADVVTAAGELIHVDKDHHADLLWALRGAGHAIGVVTSLTMQLHPIAPAYPGGTLMFPFELAGKVIRTMRDIMQNPATPQTLVAIGLFVVPPPIGKPVVVIKFYEPGGSSLQAVEKLIEPLVKLGPFMQMVAEIPYLTMQHEEDHLKALHGFRQYWGGAWLRELPPDGWIDEAMKAFGELGSLKGNGMIGGAFILEFTYRGKGVHGAPADSIIPRDVRFGFLENSLWREVADDDKVIQMVREHKKRLTSIVPACNGSYRNYLNNLDTSTADDAGLALAASLNKYQQLKKQYDAHNMFAAYSSGHI